MTQHRQYRCRDAPALGGGVTGAKYAWTLMFGKCVLSLRMPALVISWQSYSSMRSRLWQACRRWSRLASVIRGQLSNSNTARCSAAHGERANCRMPSSVISSQWDKLNFSNLGHPIDKWMRVASVIKRHSSRSIFSNNLQFFARAWKPASVKWVQATHSSTLRSGQCCANVTRDASVRFGQFDRQT